MQNDIQLFVLFGCLKCVLVFFQQWVENFWLIWSLFIPFFRIEDFWGVFDCESTIILLYRGL